MGLPWLTLIARRGGLGTIDRAVTQRVMRHHDATQRAREQQPIQADSPPQDDEPSYGVALGIGLDKAVVRHYPELMLILPQGRIAIQIQGLPPAPRQLAAQIAAYGADPHIIIALYLVDSTEIAKTIATIADQLGLGNPTTNVQTFAFDPETPITTAL